jgi:Protein of unknown function (DUF1194)
MTRLLRLCLALLAALLVLPAPSPLRAQEHAVDLELVLAVDVSLSMDHDEQRLQRDGYVEAFRDADVIAAIRANGLGRIGVAYMEWAGSVTQKIVIPWTLVDGAAAASQFADRLAAEPISRAQRTSISGGLIYAGRMFETSGFKGKRRVIDVSGDGPNNDGVPIEGVRRDLVARGITINGLPIMLKQASGWFDLENLDEYYEDCVIGGFAAFSIPIKKKAEFSAAIKRKLLLEIAEAPARLIPTQGVPGGSPGQATPPAREGSKDEGAASGQRVDCLIGEKRWQQYMGGRRGTF